MRGIDDFEGDWQIERVITDRLLQQNGTLTGRAQFRRSGPDTLEYAEEGALQMGDGPKMEARRSYRWQFGPDQVHVMFDDGRAFHSFVPSGYAHGTDHPCGDDDYAVRYDFIPWPQWRTVWLVSGPRKDYSSVTTFCR